MGMRPHLAVIGSNPTRVLLNPGGCWLRTVCWGTGCWGKGMPMSGSDSGSASLSTGLVQPMDIPSKCKLVPSPHFFSSLLPHLFPMSRRIKTQLQENQGKKDGASWSSNIALAGGLGDRTETSHLNMGNSLEII